MKCTKKMLLAAAVSAGLAGAASAAPTFTLSSNVSAYYAPADSGLAAPLPVPPKNAQGAYPVPGIYQVDFAVHSAGLSATQSFGSSDFKYALTNLTTNATFPDWQADSRQVDSNGATKGGLVPLWDTNALFGSGTNTDVITGVAVGSAFAAVDPRLYVGQGSGPQTAGGVPAANQIEDPTFIGSVYVNYTGGTGTFSFTSANVADRNNTTNQYEILGSSALTVPGPITFASVPEPASLGLLALGGLLGARRRRA